MGVRHLLRRLGGSSGQTTVEFAFVVPLLCILLIVSVDLGRAVLCWLDATHLANMGARLAAVNSGPPSGTTLQDWIRGEAVSKDVRGADSTSSVPSPARVCIDFPTNQQTQTAGQKGDPVRVTVSVDYHLIPFVGMTLPLEGSATMRLEQAPTFASGCSS